jgi:hypothetical protein
MTPQDLEKQLNDIETIDISSLTQEQLQELIEKLSFIADKGEELLSEEIDEFEDYIDDNFPNEELEVEDYGEEFDENFDIDSLNDLNK